MTIVNEGELGVFSQGIFGNVSELITGISNSSVLGQNETFQQLYSYVSVYACFGAISVAVGLLVIVMSGPVRKMMHGIH